MLSAAADLEATCLRSRRVWFYRAPVPQIEIKRAVVSQPDWLRQRLGRGCIFDRRCPGLLQAHAVADA